MGSLQAYVEHASTLPSGVGSEYIDVLERA